MPTPIEILAHDDPEVLAQQQRGVIGQLGIVYESRFARLRVDPVRFPSGHVGSHVVYALPSAPEGEPVGAVVLARRKSPRGVEVLLQWQWRHCMRAWSLEAPRGAVNHDDASLLVTGIRELAEETGKAPPEDIRLIGLVAADTGRLADRNAIIAAWYPETDGADEDAFHQEGADAEEALGRAFWLPVSDYVRTAAVSPREGEPVGPLCGITLSALALAEQCAPTPRT